MKILLRYAALLVLLCTLSFVCPMYAQSAAGEQDTETKDSVALPWYSLYRFSFKTNAFDWFAVIPNFGIEYQITNNPHKFMTVGLSAKWNWSAYHGTSGGKIYQPSFVYDIFDIRPEFRYYYRTTKKTPKDIHLAKDRKNAVIRRISRNLSRTLHLTEAKDLKLYSEEISKDTKKLKEIEAELDLSRRSVREWFEDEIWTTERKNPRYWRAHYIGAYANYSNYAFKFGEYGIRARNAFGFGATAGFVLPLHEYKKGALDIDFGFSLGLLFARHDAFTHSMNGDYYVRLAEDNNYFSLKNSSAFYKVYPIVSELRAAFIWRTDAGESVKESVNGTPKGSIQYKAAIDEKAIEAKATFKKNKGLFEKDLETNLKTGSGLPSGEDLKLDIFVLLSEPDSRYEMIVGADSSSYFLKHECQNKVSRSDSLYLSKLFPLTHNNDYKKEALATSAVSNTLRFIYQKVYKFTPSERQDFFNQVVDRVKQQASEFKKNELVGQKELRDSLKSLLDEKMPIEYKKSFDSSQKNIAESKRVDSIYCKAFGNSLLTNKLSLLTFVDNSILGSNPVKNIKYISDPTVKAIRDAILRSEFNGRTVSDLKHDELVNLCITVHQELTAKVNLIKLINKRERQCYKFFETEWAKERNGLFENELNNLMPVSSSKKSQYNLYTSEALWGKRTDVTAFNAKYSEDVDALALHIKKYIKDLWPSNSIKEKELCNVVDARVQLIKSEFENLSVDDKMFNLLLGRLDKYLPIDYKQKFESGNKFKVKNWKKNSTVYIREFQKALSSQKKTILGVKDKLVVETSAFCSKTAYDEFDAVLDSRIKQINESFDQKWIEERTNLLKTTLDKEMPIEYKKKFEVSQSKISEYKKVDSVYCAKFNNAVQVQKLKVLVSIDNTVLGKDPVKTMKSSKDSTVIAKRNDLIRMVFDGRGFDALSTDEQVKLSILLYQELSSEISLLEIVDEREQQILSTFNSLWMEEKGEAIKRLKGNIEKLLPVNYKHVFDSTNASQILYLKKNNKLYTDRFKASLKERKAKIDTLIDECIAISPKYALMLNASPEKRKQINELQFSSRLAICRKQGVDVSQVDEIVQEVNSRDKQIEDRFKKLWEKEKKQYMKIFKEELHRLMEADKAKFDADYKDSVALWKTSDTKYCKEFSKYLTKQEAEMRNLVVAGLSGLYDHNMITKYDDLVSQRITKTKRDFEVQWQKEKKELVKEFEVKLNKHITIDYRTRFDVENKHEVYVWKKSGDVYREKFSTYLKNQKKNLLNMIDEGIGGLCEDDVVKEYKELVSLRFKNIWSNFVIE